MQTAVFQTVKTGKNSIETRTKEAKFIKENMPNQILIVDSDNFNRVAMQTLVNSFGF